MIKVCVSFIDTERASNVISKSVDAPESIKKKSWEEMLEIADELAFWAVDRMKAGEKKELPKEFNASKTPERK